MKNSFSFAYSPIFILIIAIFTTGARPASGFARSTLKLYQSDKYNVQSGSEQLLRLVISRDGLQLFNRNTNEPQNTVSFPAPIYPGDEQDYVKFFYISHGGKCVFVMTSRGVLMTSRGAVMMSRGVVMTSRGAVMTSRGIVMTSRGITLTSSDCAPLLSSCNRTCLFVSPIKKCSH